MTEYLAHSSQRGYPAQTYRDHIENVLREAVCFAAAAEGFSSYHRGCLSSCVNNAALLHDLGKLVDENQSVLHHNQDQGNLPINHVDAGTSALLMQSSFASAAAVYAHHRGLPDISTEELRGDLFFRDSREEIRIKTDRHLDDLIAIHRSVVDRPLKTPYHYGGDASVFFRMVLSCLADADHSDTARHFGQYPINSSVPSLRPIERLEALDAQIKKLEGEDERSILRQTMYENCRDAELSGGFSACDSPVGSGKTTAVMAHLLRQADRRNARRVFVVLPFTSIITQSVDTYRRYLTLPGESPDAVVAELHSRAEFEDLDLRYLTSLWRAPIIVTTAVAFFETLASSQPSALRKLHELPGSVIFIDEAHAALPIHLLPLAWQWMNVLAKEWGCYWVLASGSLVRYWTIGDLIKQRVDVPDLVDEGLRHRLLKYEENRIEFKWMPRPVSRTELIQYVLDSPGPRLLIVNTVQNAAMLADDLRNRYGRERVEHLSTALTPQDRNTIVRRIETRLNDSNDTEWTLVATSCVEAGMDFSFRTGFREVASLVALLQAAGRVNRHGREVNTTMWSFVFQDSAILNKNNGMQTSADVLKGFLNNDCRITPELSTLSIEEELVRNDMALMTLNKLLEDENSGQFKSVCDEFKVIGDRTVTALADQEMLSLIREGKSDWHQLQLLSFSVPKHKVNEWKMREVAKGIYQWTLSYDSFLGYMAGVLPTLYNEMN